jgi:hypothetical protein
MDPGEYLAFIPLLIYGIALAELLVQWRRFFDKDQFYLPYFLTTIVFTEAAIWNVYNYLEVVAGLEGVLYHQYWGYLIQPMIFLLIVSALTPEPDSKDTEAYFKARMPVVFGLMAVFIFVHLFAGFGTTVELTVARGIAIALCIAIAVTRNVWLVYVMVVVWLLGLVERVGAGLF